MRLEVVIDGVITSVELDANGRDPDKGTICVSLEEVLKAVELSELLAACQEGGVQGKTPPQLIP